MFGFTCGGRAWNGAPLAGRGGFAEAGGAGCDARSTDLVVTGVGSLGGAALCAVTALIATGEGAAGVGSGSGGLVLKTKRSAPETTPTTPASTRRQRPALGPELPADSTALGRPSIPTAGADSIVVRRIEAADVGAGGAERRD